MGTLTRILTIVFVVAACLSVGLLSILWFAWDPLLPFAVWLAQMGWFDIALAILLAVTGIGLVALLVMAIALPGTKSKFSLEREGGHVSITKDAIRSTTERAIERHQGMTCKNVQVTIKGSHEPRISIKAKVDPSTNVNLVTLGTTLQREVAASVSAFAGYPAQDVNITFTSKAAHHASPLPKQTAAASHA